MAVNKVVANGETLVDLTDATVTASDLLTGVTAYGASGEIVEGTLGDFDGTAHGLVPEPSTTDSSLFLNAEGGWTSPFNDATTTSSNNSVAAGTWTNVYTTSLNAGAYLFVMNTWQSVDSAALTGIRLYCSAISDSIGGNNKVASSYASLTHTVLYTFTTTTSVAAQVYCSKATTMHTTISILKLK